MLVETDVYLMLNRVQTLSDAEAWLYAFSSDKGLQQQILDRIKSQLYDRGVDERDKIIGYYKASTEAINPQKIAGTHYTFRDKGQFFQSLYIGWFSDYFFIDGNAQKGRTNLFEKYGEGIIGLTDENEEWLHETIFNSYMEYVEGILFGA
jgi:hypothetical protein